MATRVREIINQRVEAGTSTRLDLVQQDFVVAQQRVLVPRLARLLRENAASLATLLGVTPNLVSVRGGGLGGIAIPRVSPGLPSELLQQRPDIREAEARLAAGSANLASAKVAMLPSIQLTGERGYESEILKTLIAPQSIYYNVAASITQPIFDMPRLLSQLGLQRATERELLERYRHAILSGLVDVERALIAVRETAREEQAARQALDVARRGYELSEDQLSAGNIDLTTMLNIQRSLFEAQDALMQVRLSRLRAAVALYQALGGGWKSEPAPPAAATRLPFVRRMTSGSAARR